MTLRHLFAAALALAVLPACPTRADSLSNLGICSPVSSSCTVAPLATGQTQKETTANEMTAVIAGVAAEKLSIGMADANVTLTTAQAQNATIVLTGANTGTRNLIVPVGVIKLYDVYNNTSGGHDILVKTPSGTGITITNGAEQLVRNDGTNVVAVSAGSAGGSPTGSAGGDLTGSYPNPTVAKVDGVTYPSGPSTNTVPVVTGSNTITYEALPATALASGAAASNLGAAGGDLTGTYPSPTIGGNAVSNAKAAQMAAHTIKGNNTGSTANASDLTDTQATAELNAVVGDSGSGGTKGLVPAPGSGDAAAGKFLKADGTFAVPAGTATGTVTSVATGACLTGGTITTSGTLAGSSAVDARTTTSEAVANSDQCKLVTFSNGSAVAATIAQAGSGGSFASGWMAWLENRGAGTVTLTPATSTIDGAATLALTTNQGVAIFSDGSNYFTERGAGLTGNQTITLSGDVTGSGATSITTTAAKLNGVAYASGPSTHTVPVITASNTATYKTVPDCTDTSGNHLNYTQSSDAFSCGTSSGTGTLTLNSYTTSSGSPFSWSKQAGVNAVEVVCYGAGGGGGGGTGNAATNSARTGGTGGGGGGKVRGLFRAADITSPVTVTIGIGGPHGAGGSAGAGSDATAGTNSSFGAYLVAGGGGKGAGGTVTTAKSGGAGGGASSAGGNGGTSSTTGGGPASTAGADGISGQGGGGPTSTTAAGRGEYGGGAGAGVSTAATTTNGGNSIYGSGGGGGGGGTGTGNSSSAGGIGGDVQIWTGSSGGAKGGAVEAGTNASGTTNGGGTAGAGGDSTKGGQGGGGGGGNNGGTGGTGGAGATPGGAGGGGGGGTSVGGPGGDGADGACYVWQW